MIPGTHATPTPPPVLPSLADTQLLRALQHEHRRIVFLDEHLDHPKVPQGVADAIMDARAAVAHAIGLQRDLILGAP